MPRWLAGLPLYRALAALRRVADLDPRDPARRRERGTAALFAAIAAVALVILATPASRALQSELIASHHFRPRSLARWAGLQLVPKMYSFAHICWIGNGPLFERSPRAAAEERFAREAFWVNHYPARRARFDARRRQLAAPNETRFVYLRSSYRGYSETTGFRVRAEPHRLVIERRELLP